MNRLTIACFASLAAVLSLPAFGASISIYGQIDIGGLPQPPVLVSREPVVVERVRTVREPLYLHVPPGHAKHWGKHCRKYNACNRPVYFVDEDWYERVYVPEHHGHGGPRRHDDRRRHDDGPGHEHGHGKGHGKGH
jgi:hypothetical protein